MPPIPTFTIHLSPEELAAAVAEADAGYCEFCGEGPECVVCGRGEDEPGISEARWNGPGHGFGDESR